MLIQVPAVAWREWVGSDEFLGALRRRLSKLGLSRRARVRMVDAAHADLSWHAFAALDAATRMLDSIVRSGGLRPGQQAARVLNGLLRASPERETRRRQGHSERLLVSPTSSARAGWGGTAPLPRCGARPRARAAPSEPGFPRR